MLWHVTKYDSWWYSWIKILWHGFDPSLVHSKFELKLTCWCLSDNHCLNLFYPRTMELEDPVEDFALFCRPDWARQQDPGHHLQPEGHREHRQEEGLRRCLQPPVESGCFSNFAGRFINTNFCSSRVTRCSKILTFGLLFLVWWKIFKFIFC